MARASSGSRSSISSIEPLISANRAVTVLCSPSIRAEASSGSLMSRTAARVAEFALAAALALATSAEPQSPQKRLLGALSAPHLGQRLASGAPQSPQNFLPAGFSLSQFAQRIGISEKAHPTGCTT